MTTQVNVAEAKARLSDLLDRAAAGEEVVIAKNGRPKARLVPIEPRREPRRPGAMRGRIWLAPDFDDDLSEEFERLSEHDSALRQP